jgi:hypothetical protein
VFRLKLNMDIHTQFFLLIARVIFYVLSINITICLFSISCRRQVNVSADNLCVYMFTIWFLFKPDQRQHYSFFCAFVREVLPTLVVDRIEDMRLNLIYFKYRLETTVLFVCISHVLVRREQRKLI